MKPKTIKDHLRYYRTYAGFRPRRRQPAPPAPEEPSAPKPFVVQPRDKQAARIAAVEQRLATMAQSQPEATKPDAGLARAMKQLKALESRVTALANEPKPVPKDPDEARARAKDARSIRALEARVRELEARPVMTPGLELAKARLVKAETKRAKRVKESNATPSIPSRPDNRPA